MSANDHGPTALHHYPRRFRWRAWPSGQARLYVNGRHVGGVGIVSTSGAWGAWYCGAGAESVHPRRCDAKRAVECATVRARGEEKSK